MKYTIIDEITINYFTHHKWIVNTGNFTGGECPLCGRKVKNNDTLLYECDTSNGLTINTYCYGTCGNTRLAEISSYYREMMV